MSGNYPGCLSIRLSRQPFEQFLSDSNHLILLGETAKQQNHQPTRMFVSHDLTLRGHRK